jgi:hypothetical protein
MSAGNACAAIGLANTNKVPPIGGYVQAATPPPGPEASGPHIGVNGSTYYTTNVLAEDVTVSGGYLVPADSGAAAGKTARWVTTGASPMTVAADGLSSVSATGTVTATATTGLYKVYIPPATVIPAGAYLWAFLV